MVNERNHMKYSSSIQDWEHTPNLTPRGLEIKRDELYVLSGDTIVHAYHLLMNQRAATLVTLSQLSPVDVQTYERFLSLVKHINLILHYLLDALPLVGVLQAQEALLSSTSKLNEGLTLAQILDKFHLSGGGSKDEMKPPTDETSAIE